MNGILETSSPVHREQMPGVCVVLGRLVSKFATPGVSGGVRLPFEASRAPSAPGGDPGGVSPRCSCGMGARISVELISATPGSHFLGRNRVAR